MPDDTCSPREVIEFPLSLQSVLGLGNKICNSFPSRPTGHDPRLYFCIHKGSRCSANQGLSSPLKGVFLLFIYLFIYFFFYFFFFHLFLLVGG